MRFLSGYLHGRPVLRDAFHSGLRYETVNEPFMKLACGSQRYV